MKRISLLSLTTLILLAGSARAADDPQSGDTPKAKTQATQKSETVTETPAAETPAAETPANGKPTNKPKGKRPRGGATAESSTDAARPGMARRLQSQPGNAAGGDMATDAMPGAGPLPRDMAQVVNMMLSRFDVDGDEKLDSEELTQMLTALRERQGMAGLFQGGNRPPRPNAQGKNRASQTAGSDEAGGVTPKRPPAK